jgi:hypothetical protein
MKALLPILFLLTSVSVFAQKPKVSECFKVHSLVRADAAHYWADWSNRCPYSIDSVYVLVTFTDQSRHQIGDGVFPMYFATSGAHRVTRFSVPAEVAGFAAVHVRKITSDAAEGLKSASPGAQTAQLAPGLVGDPGAAVRIVTAR